MPFCAIHGVRYALFMHSGVRLWEIQRNHQQREKPVLSAFCDGSGILGKSRKWPFGAPYGIRTRVSALRGLKRMLVNFPPCLYLPLLQRFSGLTRPCVFKYFSMLIEYWLNTQGLSPCKDETSVRQHEGKMQRGQDR